MTQYLTPAVAVILAAATCARAADGVFVGNMDLAGYAITNGAFVGDGAGLTNLVGATLQTVTDAGNTTTNTITADRGYRSSSATYAGNEWVTEDRVDAKLALFAGFVWYGSSNLTVAPYDGEGRRDFVADPPSAWTNSYTLTNGVLTYVGARIWTNAITQVSAGSYLHHVNANFSVAPGTAGSVTYRSDLVLFDGVSTQTLAQGGAVDVEEGVSEADSSVYLSSNISVTASQRLGVVRTATFTRTSGAGNATLNIYGGQGHATTPATRLTRLEGPSLAVSVVSGDGGATNIVRGGADVYDAATRTLTYNTNGLGGAGGGGNWWTNPPSTAVGITTNAGSAGQVLALSAGGTNLYWVTPAAGGGGPTSDYPVVAISPVVTTVTVTRANGPYLLLNLTNSVMLAFDSSWPTGNVGRLDLDVINTTNLYSITLDTNSIVDATSFAGLTNRLRAQWEFRKPANSSLWYAKQAFSEHWAYASSGGTVGSFGTNRIHDFTSSGSITFERAGMVNVLVVAGGGGGGAGYAAGGGGAGGVVVQRGLYVNASTYSLVVGAGGAGATGNTVRASNGTNSTAFGLTAIGGGGAAGISMTGADGGSGGGGPERALAGYTAGGMGTSGQGFAGGSSGNFSAAYTAGGGGGAGAVGQNGPAAGGAGANGGAGIALTNDLGTAYGASGWFGGGGGAGQFLFGGLGAGSAGSGGAGGGGAGGAGSGCAAGTAGTANTGGGGGGRGSDNVCAGLPGADGGSGRVIIWYPMP